MEVFAGHFTPVYRRKGLMPPPRVRQYTETLDVIEEFCRHRGHRFLRLDGSTERVRRELDVRAFNAEGSPYFAYLISTRAGGQGINLASADAVVLYDTCINPQVDLQVFVSAPRASLDMRCERRNRAVRMCLGPGRTDTPVLIRLCHAACHGHCVARPTFSGLI